MGPKPSPHSEGQSKECKCKHVSTGEVSTWTSCPFWHRSDDMGYMAMPFRNLVFRRDSTITFCEIYKSNVPKQFTTEPKSFPDLEQKEAGCLRLEAIAGGWNAGVWEGQFSMKMWDVVMLLLKYGIFLGNVGLGIRSKQPRFPSSLSHCARM